MDNATLTPLSQAYIGTIEFLEDRVTLINKDLDYVKGAPSGGLFAGTKGWLMQELACVKNILVSLKEAATISLHYGGNVTPTTFKGTTGNRPATGKVNKVNKVGKGVAETELDKARRIAAGRKGGLKRWEGKTKEERQAHMRQIAAGQGVKT